MRLLGVSALQDQVWSLPVIMPTATTGSVGWKQQSCTRSVPWLEAALHAASKVGSNTHHGLIWQLQCSCRPHDVC